MKRKLLVIKPARFRLRQSVLRILIYWHCLALAIHIALLWSAGIHPMRFYRHIAPLERKTKDLPDGRGNPAPTISFIFFTFFLHGPNYYIIRQSRAKLYLSISIRRVAVNSPAVSV